MFAVPSHPSLSLLFLCTTISISYIISISLTLLIITVFAITVPFILFSCMIFNTSLVSSVFFEISWKLNLWTNVNKRYRNGTNTIM